MTSLTSNKAKLQEKSLKQQIETQYTLDTLHYPRLWVIYLLNQKDRGQHLATSYYFCSPTQVKGHGCTMAVADKMIILVGL
jgi:hypothetical protein